MTYERFEDLPVWKEAAAFYEEVDDFLANAPPRLRPSFRDQLDRAVLSVSNNIAEGFERGTTNELLAFLYIARGSAGEARSMLCLLERRPWMKDFRSQISHLKSRAESCSRQLRAWADHLQNSDIKGQRHLNESVRRQSQQKQSAAAFQKKLLAVLPPDHPLRRQREKEESEI
jgi:four helix bundle protein